MTRSTIKAIERALPTPDALFSFLLGALAIVGALTYAAAALRLAVLLANLRDIL